MSEKNMNTRIQLKNDTETNWNKTNFIPKKGEAIVYSTDSTHPFSRLKIGDGITSVINLPFLSNGTEILEYSSSSNFPLMGESGKIYIDTLENSVYRWNGNTYVEITSSMTYDVATQSTAGLMSATDKTKLDSYNIETMTMAEYEALTQVQKMDGALRFITDANAYPDAGGVGF